METTTEQVCPACGGTILPPSVGGAKRGTCHCPENLNTEEEMPKTTKDTAPKAPEKVAPKAPKPIAYEPQGEVRQVKAGTKLALLIDLLAQGATMEQLVQVLSQSGSPVDAAGVRSWLGYDVRRVGYGVGQEGSHFFLVFPEGMTEVVAHKDATAKKAPEAKKVAEESEGAPQLKKAASRPKRDRKRERAARALKLAAK